MRVPRWVLGAGLAATLAGSGLITAGLVSAASSTTASTATSSSTSGSTSGSTSTSGSSAGTPNKVSTFINDLAKNLGTSVSTLQTALKQTETQQVQNLQTAGKITSSTASKIEKRIQAGNGTPLFGRFGRGFGPGGQAPGPVNVLQTAASYLGLTQAQLRTDLRSGKSLNAIANAQSGKSASGLQAALIAAAQTALGKRVTAGTITSAQEQTRLAGFEKNLTNILSRTGEMGREGMWRGPHMRWSGAMHREDRGGAHDR